MQRVKKGRDDSHVVLERLTDQTCAFCDDGLLTPGEYKGNQAILCKSCNTPAVQLW
ncbi:HVO_A0556 family zinc finger protein [Natrinema limicola]|uniref:HVO_A0556 family zinc finger protein n=1 Tax=Natrinema limicola TaxID=370323 RepID=UPI0026838659|nr:HVO_A0556 family zinc finger protein [Natrinema limicola]